ncbi:hypothetical protein K438DRAFT_1947137 [Mycena galopus ATCC 62051]|nr:hypothetical protein K438DRAFT_1947137 [Mycena galopus ATCC 62051]
MTAVVYQGGEGEQCYEAKDAVDYLASQGVSLAELSITLWIRRSTGGVAIEIPSKGREEFRDDTPEFPMPYRPRHRARLGTNSDTIIVSSLDFQDFCDILSVGVDDYLFNVDPGHRSVQLGAFIRIPLSGRVDELDQLAWVPNRKLLDDGWCCGQSRGIPMQNGWTHFESSEISYLSVSRCLRSAGDSSYRVWFSQANHILSCLQITNNYDDYVWVNGIDFTLHFPQSPPNGYPPLCPPEHLQTSKGLFKRTEAYAYWSPDPSGTPRPSLSESINCGFPTPGLEIRVSVRSWKWGHYHPLHRFHLGKGFDPDSQDVAIQLGYPLYQIRARPNPRSPMLRSIAWLMMNPRIVMIALLLPIGRVRTQNSYPELNSQPFPLKIGSFNSH